MKGEREGGGKEGEIPRCFEEAQEKLTLVVFLYRGPVCPSYLAHLHSTSWANLPIWAIRRKHRHRNLSLYSILHVQHNK